MNERVERPQKTFPFPLDESRVGYLILPVPLRAHEAERMAEYLASLVIADAETAGRDTG